MWPNPQETADLVTFTEEIHNEKLYVFYELDQQPYFFNFGWKIFENCSLSSRSNYFKKNKLVAEPTFYLKISFSHVNHPHKNFKMLNQIIDTDCKSTCTDLLIVILEQTPHINFSVIIPFKPSRPIIQRCVYITYLY